ncbi:MAG: SMI1/KNR4 family protein [Pseudomonadales bacterium]
MNEVVELLREQNQDRFQSIELPDEDDLVLIQEELLLHLPPDLKDFLLHVSDVAYGSLQPVTVSDPYSHTHLPEVTSIAWEQGLARDLIPICQSNDGYFFIAQEGYIGAWLHAQGVDEDQHWDSIWDWCTEVWLQS